LLWALRMRMGHKCHVSISVAKNTGSLQFTFSLSGCLEFDRKWNWVNLLLISLLK
jgi:hypothetical protein